MSAVTLFPSLFRQKAMANTDLFAAVAALEAPGREEALHAAVRVLNHVHVVDRIFRAHLSHEPHPFTATNTVETPTLAALRDGVRETDQWYVDYTDTMGAPDLEQTLEFTFTDGQRGRMSREEILLHVATHGTYHRGAVGRILDYQSVARPPDGLTNYLHLVDPGRRLPA